MPLAEVNGQRIRFQDSASEGPAVILSHGFLMDREMFQPQVDALADEFRVITWDERGFGETEFDGEPFTYWDSARDCLALMDHLGIERAVLGGMSQGWVPVAAGGPRGPGPGAALVLIDTQAGVEDPERLPAYRQLQRIWLEAGPHAAPTAPAAHTAEDSARAEQCWSEPGRLVRRRRAAEVREWVAMSEMWDSVAPSWQANAGFVDEQLARATGVLLDAARVGEGDRVLDLAAGPGGAGLVAAQRVGSTGRVVLSDVAGEMVAVAARRASGEAQVSVAEFDQSEIGFGDDSFDAVINRHGLMFVEDPVQAVAEAVRVLRAGGRYAVMTWNRRELNPWLGLALDAVGAQFGVPFPPPNVRGPFSLDNPDALTSVLEGGGLEDVTVEAMSTPMGVASLGEWWDRVPKLAGPLAIALAAMDADVRDAIGERARQSAREAAVSEGDRLVFDGSVLIGSGRKPPSLTGHGAASA